MHIDNNKVILNSYKFLQKVLIGLREKVRFNFRNLLNEIQLKTEINNLVY
jgi:hypothetical protein